MAVFDRLRRVALASQKRLRSLASKTTGRIISLSKAAGGDLIDGIQAIVPARASSTPVESVVAPITGLIQRLGSVFGASLGGVVEDAGRTASGYGRANISAQLKTWNAAGLISGDLVSPGLLEYYRTSRQRYGLASVVRMRDQLAQAALNGETVSQAADRLQASIGLARFQADRIAKTETSFAFHRRWLQDANTVLGSDAQFWRKELVAVFDGRTGADSRFVHGQRRRLSEPFRDNQGRVYMMPPNRPNDRETAILVKP